MPLQRIFSRLVSTKRTKLKQDALIFLAKKHRRFVLAAAMVG
jgi:hypothetical protein